jgi:hypothetical protein
MATQPPIVLQFRTGDHPMNKKLTVEAFRVEMPKRAPSLEQIIRQVEAMPLVDRNRDVRDNPMRLQEIFMARQLSEGGLVRIRLNFVPVSAKLSGEVKPFTLEDGEGVGEETAFLFHAPTRVLLLQRNRMGVSATAFASYFENIGQLDEPIGLDPVLRPNAMRKLQSMREVRKFNFKVTGADASFYRDPDRAVTGSAQIIKEFGAPNVEIVMSMGRNQSGLNMESVLKTARKLFTVHGEAPNAVTKIQLTGRNNHDESTMVDLIHDRIVEEIMVDVQAGKPVSYATRRSVLHHVWDKRGEELRAMFDGE